jgi:hypothetical protein
MNHALVDLDDRGLLLAADRKTPIPGHRIPDHLARHLRVPEQATDLFLYVHGWQTTPDDAVTAAVTLVAAAIAHLETHPALYPRLEQDFRPWTVIVRWDSASPYSRNGYKRIKERAHAMSRPPGHPDGTGYAPQVIGHLLGYLDASRGDPSATRTQQTHHGQYLHLLGHSFGGRLLCEGLQWASSTATHQATATMGWSTPHDPRRPFTVDSALILQMAAHRDILTTHFPYLFPPAGRPGAPLRGPLVLTHSQWDRATGLWHTLAEGSPGIGHSGTSTAPVPQFNTHLHSVGEPYTPADLDHRLVNVDAGRYYRAGGIIGAHSDFHHPETAHLMLSLAEHSR